MSAPLACLIVLLLCYIGILYMREIHDPWGIKRFEDELRDEEDDD